MQSSIFYEPVHSRPQTAQCEKPLKDKTATTNQP